MTVDFVALRLRLVFRFLRLHPWGSPQSKISVPRIPGAIHRKQIAQTRRRSRGLGRSRRSRRGRRCRGRLRSRPKRRYDLRLQRRSHGSLRWRYRTHVLRRAECARRTESSSWHASHNNTPNFVQEKKAGRKSPAFCDLYFQLLFFFVVVESSGLRQLPLLLLK